MKFEPGVTDITIPDNMKEIYEQAFKGCTSLTSVNNPDSVTKIGWEAFADCTNLTSITIPDSVTRIEYDAFRGCTSLETINVSPSFSYLNKFDLSNTKWYKDQTDLAILSAVLIQR